MLRPRAQQGLEGPAKGCSGCWSSGGGTRGLGGKWLSSRGRLGRRKGGRGPAEQVLEAAARNILLGCSRFGRGCCGQLLQAPEDGERALLLGPPPGPLLLGVLRRRGRRRRGPLRLRLRW